MSQLITRCITLRTRQRSQSTRSKLNQNSRVKQIETATQMATASAMRNLHLSNIDVILDIEHEDRTGLFILPSWATTIFIVHRNIQSCEELFFFFKDSFFVSVELHVNIICLVFMTFGGESPVISSLSIICYAQIAHGPSKSTWVLWEV